jgi:hypothetical protein
MNRRWGTVESILCCRTDSILLRCRMADGAEADAVAITPLCGQVAVGERVLLNTTAVDLNLGTGGRHFVIVSALGDNAETEHTGHIIKLRYTPSQVAVQAVEEPDSVHHDAMAQADSLMGMPVVCCELVSQVPAVIAGLRGGHEKPGISIVVTDEGALDAALCDLLTDLRSGGLVDSVISTGQCFGGDIEAINLHSGTARSAPVRAGGSAE